jgi:hypothetical protein
MKDSGNNDHWRGTCIAFPHEFVRERRAVQASSGTSNVQDAIAVPRG